MQSIRARRLFLEQLEDRMTPSLSITFVSGNLFIRGTPIDITPGLGLQITGQANGNFLVADGTKNLGSFHVTSNLEVLLASHPNDITVNLAGLPGSKYGGNILIDVGIGNTDTVVNDHPVQVRGGTVGGWVTLRGGSGGEDYELGVNGSSAGGTADPVTIGGDVSVSGKNAVSSNPLGDVVQLGPGSRVGGNFTAGQIDFVALGNSVIAGTALTTVGRSVTINDTGSPVALFVDDNGLVGGNLTVNGSGRPDATFGFGDLIQLHANGVTNGGVVLGNVAINLGSYSVPSGVGDNVIMNDGAVVNGNVTITNSLISSNSLSFGTAPGTATINGSLSLNLGNGDNTVTLAAAGQGTGATVNGNVSVTAGNGNNQFLLNGSVNGNLGFHLGNGNDSATLGGPVAGLLSFYSGNGNDSVTVGSGALSYFLNLVFGNGDDTVNLATTGLVQGLVDGGGSQTRNVFNQGGATLQTITLLNFP